MQKRFIEKLLSENLIDQETYQKILDIHRDTGETFPSIIRDGNILPEHVLLEKIEEFYKITAISLDEFEVEPEAVEVVPEKIARQLEIVPLFLMGDTLVIATDDPYNIDAFDYLKIATGKKIQPYVSFKSQILRKLDEIYVPVDSLEKAIKIMSEDKIGEAAVDDYIQDIKARLEEHAPVVQLVNQILQQGYTLGASDIHIEPLQNRVSLRYRIDGILHEFPGPPKVLYHSIISRIKILANMDVAERRHPQDGRINMNIYGENIDFRVSIMPFIYGQGAVIRILGRKATYVNLDDLGFEPDDLARVKRVLSTPFGLMLATGPTGSGKTTTLFSAINFLNSPEKKIITLEDPVEQRIEGVMQLQVNEEIGLSFVDGLKAVLRHDPDIVMLGEIRDRESAEICIRLALTGQLVLSTLHTNDASTAIDRLIEIGIPSYLVSETLIAALAQRLLRKLCEKCKIPDGEVDEDIMQCLKLIAAGKEEITLYKSSGCKECNFFGYKGRTAIFEILVNDWDFKTAISRRDFDSYHVRTYLRSKNVRSLRESGLLKAIKGITSLKEVFANTIEDVYQY